MLILAYADSSFLLGEGHCMRVHNLLQEFSGETCIWLYRSMTPRCMGLLSGYYDMVNVSDDISQHIVHGVDFLVVDSYEVLPEVISRYLDDSTKRVVFDDLADRIIEADILIDGSPVRSISDYDGLVSPSCIKLIGLDYVVINKAYRCKLLSGKNVCHLYFGATDNQGLTLPYLIALLGKLPDFSFHVVITRQTPGIDEIYNIAGDNSERIFLFYEPDGLLESFNGCRIAVGAPGIATWERMASGLTSFLVSTNHNQVSILEKLHNMGAIFYMGSGYQIDSCIKKLSEAIDDFKPVSVVVDGFGAQRVAEEVRGLTGNA